MRPNAGRVVTGWACDEEAGREALENNERPAEEAVAAEEAGVTEKPVKELVVPDEAAAELAGAAVEVVAVVLTAGGAVGVTLKAGTEKEGAWLVLLAAGVAEAVVVVTVENKDDEVVGKDNEAEAGAADEAEAALVKPKEG